MLFNPSIWCSTFWLLPASLVPASSLAAPSHPFPPAKVHRMWFSGRSVCFCAPSSSAHVCPLALWSAAPSPLSSETPAKLSSPSLGPIRYHSLVLSSVTAPEDAGRHYNSFLCLQLLSLSLTHRRHSSIF